MIDATSYREMIARQRRHNVETIYVFNVVLDALGYEGQMTKAPETMTLVFLHELEALLSAYKPRHRVQAESREIAA